MDQKCKRAIKILEQFDRLARKLKARLAAGRLARLKALRDAGQLQRLTCPPGCCATSRKSSSE